MEPTEQIQVTVDQVIPFSDSAVETQPASEAAPVVAVDSEPQISDIERERWIWTFEKLKAAEIGLSLSEKVKFFCEAGSPEEVEKFIQAQLDDLNIIPLAA